MKFILAWLRPRCNRILSINLLFMLGVVGTWWIFQSVPVLVTLPKQDELFFGMVSKAQQSALFGRVTFQINGDPNAKFVLWMNPANRDRFDEWFGPGIGYQITARRTFQGDWIVYGMECAYGGLDMMSLWNWRLAMSLLSLLLAYASYAMFFAIFKEYLLYYRFRPWFRIPRK